jgi:hypothetical protein
VPGDRGTAGTSAKAELQAWVHQQWLLHEVAAVPHVQRLRYAALGPQGLKPLMDYTREHVCQNQAPQPGYDTIQSVLITVTGGGPSLQGGCGADSGEGSEPTHFGTHVAAPHAAVFDTCCSTAGRDFDVGPCPLGLEAASLPELTRLAYQYLLKYCAAEMHMPLYIVDRLVTSYEAHVGTLSARARVSSRRSAA